MTNLLQPASGRFVKIVVAGQLLVMCVATVLSLVYMHDASYAPDGRPADVDHQFTSIGWAFAALISGLCAVLLAVSLRRLSTGAGRRAPVLASGQIGTFLICWAMAAAASGRPNVYVFFFVTLVLTMFGCVAVLGVTRWPLACAWARRRTRRRAAGYHRTEW